MWRLRNYYIDVLLSCYFLMGEDFSKESRGLMLGFSQPELVEVADMFLAGHSVKRLMITLRGAGGCQHALESGGCTYCGFGRRGVESRPCTSQEIMDQFHNGIKGLDFEVEGIEQMDLFNSGSFLNDAEIPLETQLGILRRAAQIKGLKKVMVESRPEFIAVEKILAVKKALGDKSLEIGIGLETADDNLRNQVLRKGYTRVDYERAVEILGKTDAELLTYVMLKPTVMDEEQAVQDVVATIKYISEIAQKYRVKSNISLSPTFVPKDTKLFEQFQSGVYTPPTLWSIVEALKRCHQYSIIRIGLSDEGFASDDPRKSRNCGKCDQRVIEALNRFNETQDIKVLEDLHCDCKRE